LFLKKYYQPTAEKDWQGRIDDETNFRSFRWHQWVKKFHLLEDDIKAAPGGKEKNFCFLGFFCDKGVRKNKGRAGAAKGPLSIRQEMGNLPCNFAEEVKLFDAGNINCSGEASLEEGQKALEEAVEKILKMGFFPIVLGGGHEIALGNYNGIKKYVYQENPGIINFDAHFDLRPYPDGGNSGTMFLQIADQCQKEGSQFSYLALGIQKYGNTKSLFDKAHEIGAEYVLARDIKDYYIIDNLEKIDTFIKRKSNIYLTICADVFSSAFAPGVSSSHPLGLEPEIFLRLFKHILRSGKVVGFDIAEVSPRFDLDQSTAQLAAIIIFAAVNVLGGYDD